MKKNITILFIAFALIKVSKAQGNLQFNRTFLMIPKTETASSADTVPTGKVWKIESYLFQGGFNSVSNNNTFNFYSGNNNNPYYGLWVNGKTLSLVVGGNTTATSLQTFGPMWMPAGTRVFSITSSIDLGLVFSVIEFNLVP